MQRVETAPPISLRPTETLAPVKRATTYQSIAFIIFATLLIRLAFIGVASLLSVFDRSGVVRGVVETLNNQFFLGNYAVAIGLAVYIHQRLTRGGQMNVLFETFTYMLRNRSAVIGTVLILFILLVGDFASVIATHDPLQPLFGTEGLPPRPQSAPPCIPAFGCEYALNILGIDLNVRDIFSRIVYGARTSLTVGIASVSFAIMTGTLIGLISGYVGGLTDNIIMMVMDALLAFPSLLLAIAIVTIWGPGLDNALLAIAIVSIPIYARLTRASVLSVKELEFVTAERSLGAPPMRILFQQILPHTLTPLIVQGTLGIGGAVLEAAALSFIGLGAQPPQPEWGQMLSESRSYVFSAPHLVFFPGIAIMITVLGFNLLGDGLRDALDPRLSRR
jgi:peptide/nickel transport system permease protein